MGDLEIANYICKSISTRIELITFIHITEGTDIILTMSYRSGFGSPKPVEMGKEYEVEISEISRRGDGIARIQGFVIFVEGAKSGQKANIRITSVGDRFAKAQLV
jgi:predicted RNA-binding protein with TRAM domain